jgi:hypothetical protein
MVSMEHENKKTFFLFLEKLKMIYYFQRKGKMKVLLKVLLKVPLSAFLQIESTLMVVAHFANLPYHQLCSSGIHLSINYSVLNEMKQYE